jgi:hypothetical protein
MPTEFEHHWDDVYGHHALGFALWVNSNFLGITGTLHVCGRSYVQRLGSKWM